MKQPVSYRIDLKVKQKVDKLAKQLGVSRTKIVEEAVKLLETSTKFGGPK